MEQKIVLLLKKIGKFGLCDDTGNIIIEPNYKKIEKIGDDYKNCYIVTNENDKFGIIGFDKNEILEAKYDEIKPICAEDNYVVKENGKYIVINKSGEKQINKEFEDIEAINKDYVIAKSSEGKYGVVDRQGETKIDFKYDKLSQTNSANYIAKQGDKYGIVNIDGNIQFEIKSIGINYVESGDFIIADYIENRKTYFKSLR